MSKNYMKRIGSGIWQLVVQFPVWATLILTTSFGATLFAVLGAIFKFFKTEISLSYIEIAILGTLMLSLSALVCYFFIKDIRKTPDHRQWWVIVDDQLKLSWKVALPRFWLDINIATCGPVALRGLIKGPYHAVPECFSDIAMHVPPSFRAHSREPLEPPQPSPHCPRCKADLIGAYKELGKKTVTLNIDDINAFILLDLQRMHRSGAKLHNNMKINI